jgi:hypothetical protein
MAVDNTAEIYTQFNVTLGTKQALNMLQSYLQEILEGKLQTESNSMYMTEQFIQINSHIRRLANVKNSLF